MNASFKILGEIWYNVKELTAQFFHGYLHHTSIEKKNPHINAKTYVFSMKNIFYSVFYKNNKELMVFSFNLQFFLLFSKATYKQFCNEKKLKMESILWWNIYLKWNINIYTNICHEKLKIKFSPQEIQYCILLSCLFIIKNALNLFLCLKKMLTNIRGFSPLFFQHPTS